MLITPKKKKMRVTPEEALGFIAKSGYALTSLTDKGRHGHLLILPIGVLYDEYSGYLKGQKTVPIYPTAYGPFKSLDEILVWLVDLAMMPAECNVVDTEIDKIRGYHMITWKNAVSRAKHLKQFRWRG